MAEVANARAAMRPLHVGEVLDVATRVVRRNFKAFLLLLLPAVAILQGASAANQIGSLPGGAFLFGDDLDGFATTNRLWSLIIGVVTLILMAAAVHLSSATMLGEKARVGQAVGIGLRRSLSLLVLTVIWLVLGFLSFFTFLGLLFVATVFSVAVPVCVIERRNPFRSIGRSFQLTIRRFFPTLGAIVVAAIPMVLFFYILLISVLLASLDEFINRRSLVRVVVVMAVVSTIAITLFTMFAAALQTVLFYDLRVRLEGTDLAAWNDDLVSDDQRTPSGAAAIASGAGPPSAPWGPDTEKPRPAPNEPEREEPRARPESGRVAPPWERPSS